MIKITLAINGEIGLLGKQDYENTGSLYGKNKTESLHKIETTSGFKTGM